MEVVRKIVSADVLSPFIDLPWRYKGLQVEVIIKPQIKEKPRQHEVSVEILEGCLKEYANPALWEKEQNAWADHVVEKYGYI